MLLGLMTLNCMYNKLLNSLRHDTAATCMLKMPLNPSHPSISVSLCLVTSMGLPAEVMKLQVSELPEPS